MALVKLSSLPLDFLIDVPLVLKSVRTANNPLNTHVVLIFCVPCVLTACKQYKVSQLACKVVILLYVLIN